MKKTFVLFAMAATVLAACTKEQPITDGPVVKTVLSIGSAETKTTVGDVENDGANDFRRLYWANGDKVNANGVASLELTGLTPGTVTKTDFSFTEDVTAPYSVVYPAAIYKDASTVSLLHNVGDQVIPMAGVSQTTAFALNPLTGILQLKIKQAANNPDTDHIVLIEVSTASTRMSGDFTINYSTGALTPAASPSGNDLAVQITGDWALSSSETSFFIPVPAGNYNFTVKVMDKKGHFMTKSTTTPKSFAQGVIQPLKAFEFVPSATDGIEIDTPEKLIAFAQAYNNGDYKDLDKDLVVTVTADLAFNATTSAAFNATGGIGAGGNDDPLFNGVFDGGNYAISGLEATVPLFARVGQYGTVKSLTIASSSSFSRSEEITSNLYLASVAGYCKGNITDCINNAPVTCSASAYSSNVLYIGGVVARQNQQGSISGCENFGAVTCTTSNGSGNIYMGGIAGAVERPGASDTAIIQNCVNTGVIKNGLDSGEPTQACILHMGGVVGWINSTGNSAKMTVVGLINEGDVIKTKTASNANTQAVLVGGVVGGIHGSSISNASGVVEVKECQIKNCSIQNGDINSANGYGSSAHTGGFVGVVRGGSVSFDENCYVKNANVICCDGYAGGFAAWVYGVSFVGCKVLNSSVQGSLAQCRIGGGLVGHMRGNSSATNCIVTLTKDDAHSLWGRGNNTAVTVGGIAGAANDACIIDGCKAFVKLLYVSDANSDNHGWVVGNGSNFTVKDCYLGGTYGNGTPSITLDSSNFSDYISGGTAPTLQGTQHYWDGSDAPTGSMVETINIASYASAHGWTNDASESPQTITQGNVTLTASNAEGQSQNGNYNTQWRFYQARGGGLTVTVSNGHSLVRVTFTCGTGNNGGILIAPDGVTQLPSGTPCSLSGNSAMFTIGSSTGKTNGRVDITQIVIEYE